MKNNIESILEILVLTIALLIITLIAFNMGKLSLGLFSGLNPFSNIYASIALNYMMSVPGDFNSTINVFKKSQELVEFRISGPREETQYNFVVEYGYGVEQNVLVELVIVIIQSLSTMIGPNFGIKIGFKSALKGALPFIKLSAGSTIKAATSLSSYLKMAKNIFFIDITLGYISMIGSPNQNIILSTPEIVTSAAIDAAISLVLSAINKFLMAAGPIGILASFALNFIVYGWSLINDLINAATNVYFSVLYCNAEPGKIYKYVSLSQIPISYNAFIKFSFSCLKEYEEKVCAAYQKEFLYKMSGYCKKDDRILFAKDLLITKDEKAKTININSTVAIE